MAFVTYSLGVESFKGSVGGATFQRNRAGNIVRKRPRQRKNSTFKQIDSQLFLMQIMSAWQLILFSDKVLWNDFAIAYPKTNAFGEIKYLSGLNWFTSINENRIRMGLNVLNQPPTYYFPPPPPPFSLVVSNSSLSVQFNPIYDHTDLSLFIRCTSPISFVTKLIRSSYRLISIIPSGSSGLVDITEAWSDYFSYPYPPSSVSDAIQFSVQIQAVSNLSGIASLGAVEVEQISTPLSGIGIMQLNNNFIVG